MTAKGKKQSFYFLRKHESFCYSNTEKKIKAKYISKEICMTLEKSTEFQCSEDSVEVKDMFFLGLSDAEGNLEFLSAMFHLSLSTTK